jgi:excisionase family DNA binding protein
MRKNMSVTISVDEVAEVLGVSRGSAYKAAHSGELPTIKIGKRLLILRDQFERMLDEPIKKSKAGAA